jgi:hypothetical protein
MLRGLGGQVVGELREIKITSQFLTSETLKDRALDGPREVYLPVLGGLGYSWCVLGVHGMRFGCA